MTFQTNRLPRRTNLMRKLTMCIIAVAMIALNLSAEVAYDATSADAQPSSDVLPYWEEPSPVCGSDLHLTEGLDCLAPSAPGLVAVGARVCPALSQGRFDGGSYDYMADPLGVVTYSNPNIVERQAIDDSRTWQRYCAIPVVSSAVVTPDPTPTPTMVATAACPEGLEWVGTSGTGVILCAPPTPTVTPTATPAAVPITGQPTINFTGPDDGYGWFGDGLSFY